MRIDNLPIGTRVALGFALMIACSLLVGYFGIKEMEHVGSLTQRLYRHPLTVGYTIRDVHIHLFELHELVTGLATDTSPARLDAVERAMHDIEQSVDAEFDVIAERYLGKPEDVARAREAFASWKRLRADIFAAIRPGQASVDWAEVGTRMDSFLSDATTKVQVLRDFALNKAASFLSDAEREQDLARYTMAGIAALVALIGLAAAMLITRSVSRPLAGIVAGMGDIAAGDLEKRMDIRRGDEIGALADSFRAIQASLLEKTRVAEAIAGGDFGQRGRLAGERDMLGKAMNRMSKALETAWTENRVSDWLKTGQNDLGAALRGETDPHVLGTRVLAFLAPYVGARVASLYLLGEDGRLAHTAGYAFSRRGNLDEAIELGQGLVGQAGLEQTLISVTDIPEDYLRIDSSLGAGLPRNVVAVPFARDGKLIGVMELGAFAELSDTALEFLRRAAEPLAAAFDAIQHQARLKVLLDRTSRQAAALQEQQEELRAVNEELEAQTQALIGSESALKLQREELQVLNEELEEKNSHLEEQQKLVVQKNAALDANRLELEEKATELAAASRYKSEFLANMSHELRTPLNSLLILSRTLSENPRGTLAPQDVEAASVIHKSGNDLLQIINDILDLSKIEAGRMTLHLETVRLDDLLRGLDEDFRRLAEHKGLALEVAREPGLPGTVRTDGQRLVQILRNLLSNAVKFTETGGVAIGLRRPAADEGSRLAVRAPHLDPARTVVFSVSDTGIGIPGDKHAAVFEAFRQVDGSISRKYGGTGLGLSICRQLAEMLGGTITLDSEPGRGATFTLYLPETPAAPAHPGLAAAPVSERPARPPAGGAPPSPAPPRPVSVSDDRAGLGEGERAILIVEDDPDFARILRDLCRAKEFKVLVALTGEEGLTLADSLQPLAVILDIRLPGINGWTVLGALKENPRTRHIPVHVMSGCEAGGDALSRGAIGFLPKPAGAEELDRALARIEAVVSKKVKDVLLVEDNLEMRVAIMDLVGDVDVEVAAVETGRAALAALAGKAFDCLILDLGLGDMSGLELLKLLEAERGHDVPPVIVYTGKDLTKEEERELSSHADSIIVKGVRSEDRLLDEVSLFLHRMVSSLPRHKQKMIINLHDRDSLLAGRTVLAVDDDMRNLFAVSRVLEEKGVTVLKAEDGQRALQVLKEHPEVDLVLLDIMMPVMDGYETMRRIRAEPGLARLPIIALTAKAMKEDRETCIAEGASDYLAKPVDVDRLLSMMRVWLYKA